MRTFITAAALALLVHSAQAAPFTGNDLVQECEAQTPMCTGFLLGVSDIALQLKAVCVPAASTNQLRAVVLSYLRKNPNRWHENAARLVRLALLDAWPCFDLSEPKP
jgi:hypothetical protein